MGVVRRTEYLAEEDAVVIELEEPMYTLSSALEVGGGQHRHIVFKRVGTSDDLGRPHAYASAVAGRLGLDEAIVFLTATPVEDYVHRVLNAPYETHVFATIALAHPACIGLEASYPPLRAGTINVFVATSAPLARTGRADLFKTVVEAKTLASAELLLRCRSRAAGTVSDAVAVASPDGDIVTAGMATELGGAVAREVHQVIVAEGVKRLGLEGMLRGVLGVGVDELVELALKAYSRAPVPGLSLDHARSTLRRKLMEALDDPNVWALLVAARELDLHAAAGALPGLSVEEFHSDTVKVVADELIGIALALYLAGAKGLFSMYWVERMKKSLLPEIDSLPMFEDDAASALIGSLLTLLYNEALRRGAAQDNLPGDGGGSGEKA